MTAPAPSSPVPRAAGDLVQRARTLVLAYGWNATAYQIVNPGISLWFAPGGDAVVGYVRAQHSRVVAGAPVCPHERLPAVIAEFEAECAAEGERTMYFGAEERLDDALRDSPSHSKVLLGAQPAWDPHDWPDIVARRASLRAQLNRARNKGVVVRERQALDAGDDPALRRTLDEWLHTRGLPPLHFLVEPETLSRMWDRRLFVAERGAEVVGFLVASPVPERHGWLVEQIVRGRGAPNGTNELLVDAAMRTLAADGTAYVTLGLSPLSSHIFDAPEVNPLWLRYLLRWVRAHGRRFYNFEGLDRFKSKFSPARWEPVYAIYARPRFSIGALRAIAAAFTGESPELTLVRAIVRAVRTEAGWLRARIERRQSEPVRG